MAHVDNLRRHFPALRRIVYLNTGSAGALPDETVQAMTEAISAQLHEGRRGDRYWQTLAQMRQLVRSELAHLFHAKDEAFVLTSSTTEGMNLALWSIPLAPGDEIITTDVEHPGAALPMAVQRQRRGVRVRVLDGTLSKEELCHQFEQAITPKTRVLVCSHVSYATGRRFPLESLSEIAHRYGVWVVVDGAQGAGAEALDLGTVGIDLYAFPGHKWLCGPQGTGALYVNPRRLQELDVTFAGTSSLREATAWTPDGHYLPAPTAARFEHSEGEVSLWLGWWQSLHFLRVTAGWEYIFSRTHGLSGLLMDKLFDLPGVTVVTPRDQRAGLVHLRLDKVDANAALREARARDIDIRTITDRGLLRVSTAFYNTENEVQRFLQVIEGLCRS
ncbi:MAG: aminotransferase class V-fold PLP-dependent enzyme [Alicyclobacillus herbarius]|uniref:aminotransferase class V-fold PLP-dependent enzyme n=1 Tax=Alicyclobacillus herbarius TaxID=122960 RepID=UPI00235656EE|nr:aminotransferase class V-fold PLP-dependent enzyme [Alicyclobacillus herbarius]MCL6631020.1 aminotransferase class V-fold PLP-dependent enzyme [Alicyclobacillus herbarius]